MCRVTGNTETADTISRKLQACPDILHDNRSSEDGTQFTFDLQFCSGRLVIIANVGVGTNGSPNCELRERSRLVPAFPARLMTNYEYGFGPCWAVNYHGA
ncbi:hypothetical protein J6590_000639 [Homalodisca vitripennis]|nr:hypothetical protein J6590_000639 [Homalodisca vitripennis]